jgi:hypothetical protein
MFPDFLCDILYPLPNIAGRGDPIPKYQFFWPLIFNHD